MSKFVLRDYQERVVSNLIDFVLKPENQGKVPLINSCVGSGKNPMISTTSSRLISMFPSMRILVLVHTKELVDQNSKGFKKLYPNIKSSVYMDSLGKKDSTGQVVFGSVQSVEPDIENFTGKNAPDVIMVDECHWINKQSSGRYRNLIEKIKESHPSVLVIGWTGTIWRMDGGSLIDGKDKLFTDVVAEVTIAELLKLGYLSPLVLPSSEMRVKYDTSNIEKTKTGDFDKDALEDVLNNDKLIKDTVEEYYRLSQGRKKHIIFGSRIKHCQSLKEAFSKYYKCEFISGSMSKRKRELYIKQFKNGELDMLISGIILTTGFDVPDIDSIGLCRDVASSALYCQIAGRGLRIAEGKDNCLWIDFTETTQRHGPVDQLKPPPFVEPSEKGIVTQKICPSCKEKGEIFVLPIQTKICPQCDYIFSDAECTPNHRSEASNASILSKDPEFRLLTSFSVSRYTSDADKKQLSSIRKKVESSGQLTANEESFKPKSWAKFTFSFGLSSYTKMLCFDNEKTRGMACMFWRKIVKPEYRDSCPHHAENAIMLIQNEGALLPIKEMKFTFEEYYFNSKGQRKKLSSARLEELIDVRLYD